MREAASAPGERIMPARGLNKSNAASLPRRAATSYLAPNAAQTRLKLRPFSAITSASNGARLAADNQIKYGLPHSNLQVENINVVTRIERIRISRCVSEKQKSIITALLSTYFHCTIRNRLNTR